MALELLQPEHVFVALRAAGKQALLAELAGRAARSCGLEPGTIAAALMAREALGSTGFGGGIAVPHARLPGLAAPLGMLAVLSRPVDFAAIDGRKVDLVFLLLTPQGDDAAHLSALAAVSRRLRDGAVAAQLRSARTPSDAIGVFVGKG